MIVELEKGMKKEKRGGRSAIVGGEERREEYVLDLLTSQ